MWLLGKPAVVVQASMETLTVDYPMVEHSAVGKQTVNYFADSSVVESSADAPIVEDSTVGQQTANYFGNSSDAVPSVETPEAESLATKQQLRMVLLTIRLIN